MQAAPALHVMSSSPQGNTSHIEQKARAASPALRKRPVSGDQDPKAVRSPVFKPQATLPKKGMLSSLVSARSIQCYLLLGTRMVQQMMRNALSPLLVFMSRELEISTSQKGTLLSAIAVGYFFTQVPGGALADRLGAKNVTTFSLLLSSLCCFAAPIFVEQFGMSGLWLVMVVMGAVQGPLFPTSTVYLSKWMPRKVENGSDEKAWGTSMLDIGISVGSLLVIPLANTLAEALGWRFAYNVIGFISLAFIALWQLLAAEQPSKCFFISKEELEFLEANISKPQSKLSKVAEASDSKDNESSDSPGLLGIPTAVAIHPGLWAVFVAHIAFNYGAYYLTNWSPTYYSEVLNISPSEAKYHLMFPHITNLAAKMLNPALNTLVDQLGFSLLQSRRLFTVAGFFLSGSVLLPVFQLRHTSPWVSTILFSAANAFFGLAPSGFKANYLDITEKYVGVISGYGNTLGTVASWVGPQFVAFLLQQFESWDLVLASVAAVNAFAAVNYLIHATVTPLEQSVVAASLKARDPWLFVNKKAQEKKG